MKIGFYDPYLDTIGGGERYILTLASHWAKKYQVDVFWDDRGIKRRLEERLGLDLRRIKIVQNFFSPFSGLLPRLKKTFSYDLLFFLSDGSIPLTLARRNILHFQVPFVNLGGRNLGNKIKLACFQKIICNSHFTKKFIDRTFGVKSVVIYPPVAVEEFRPLEKKNWILSVGRFTTQLHAKKQHILVEVFQKMCKKGLRGWELVLAGGVLQEEEDYLQEIRRRVKGYPIRIVKDVSFGELKKLYGWAKIYWQATGFGEKERVHPERMEHFGIATVEAMAAGCVPLVLKGGGLKEIVKDGSWGFLWKEKEELLEKTLFLIQEEEYWQKMAKKAEERSRVFSQKIFCRKFDEIIKKG